MNKQEQIEKMAVIGCVRNPQAHTAEECAKCGFKYGQCNAYRHAEALYSVVISREEYEMLANKYKNLEIKYSNLSDKYRLCKDANETLKQNVITARKEATEAIYNTGYHKVDEFEECRKCPAWSGTDCTRNPYTKGCLDDKVNLKNEIKRLKKENACLLKSCEERFTFNTTQNKKYSVFNTVRKEFADRIKVLIFQKGNPYDVPFEEFVRANVFCGYIDELLKEYEK